MDTLRARHRRLNPEPHPRGRCFIFQPRIPQYTQPAPTTSADAEAARQRNAQAAVADATDNGRASTNQGGQQTAYAAQQDEQRKLMKTKNTSAAADLRIA